MFEIFSVLTHIYILTNYGHYEVIRKFAATLLFCCVVNGIKLIGNCLINGLVPDEAEKLLSCLDDISISKSTTPAFKEMVIFMSINKNLKFGFSIAGIMLFRKKALTSVRKWFLVKFFYPLIIIFIFLQIFSFVLTYSIILMQTVRNH